MPYYAHANLEVPQWGPSLGIDPRTQQEVRDPVLGADGRQVQRHYNRGDEVQEGDFTSQDWQNFIDNGAIAESPPEPDVSTGAAIEVGVEPAPEPPSNTTDQAGVS